MIIILFQLLTDEVPAIRAAFAEIDADYHPLLTVLIATKRHNRRFFENDENPPPGMVIDRGITRIDCPEFYLQSHLAIQGTAKATDYTKPVDDADMPMDEIEAFTNSLCYHHQIITSPTSLPEPVYQADEWAKRGKNNYNTYMALHGDKIPMLDDGSFDFEALTDKLCYCDSKLQMTRSNA